MGWGATKSLSRKTKNMCCVVTNELNELLVKLVSSFVKIVKLKSWYQWLTLFIKKRATSLMNRTIERSLSSRATSFWSSPTLVDRVWAPWRGFFFQYFFIYSENNLRWFSGHSENFYFYTKITPWQFCWKQRQFGLVPFKSCKLESITRAKVFGKVDTTEVCQLPQA